MVSTTAAAISNRMRIRGILYAQCVVQKIRAGLHHLSSLIYMDPTWHDGIGCNAVSMIFKICALPRLHVSLNEWVIFPLFSFGRKLLHQRRKMLLLLQMEKNPISSTLPTKVPSIVFARAFLFGGPCFHLNSRQWPSLSRPKLPLDFSMPERMTKS